MVQTGTQDADMLLSCVDDRNGNRNVANLSEGPLCARVEVHLSAS